MKKNAYNANRANRAAGEGRGLTMLEQLKNFDLNRMQMDEILSLRGFGATLKDQYDSIGVPVPDWLRDGVRRLTTEAMRRRQDDMERELAELRLAQSTDMTPTERRAAREERIKALQEALDGTTKATA